MALLHHTHVRKLRALALPMTLVALINLVSASAANAQHPIDVQRLASDGENLKALAMYELLPTRTRTTDARIAAAKSAWALGLNRKAADSFDAILREDTLGADGRARLTLSRGIIEFQEERYPEAALFAEKTVSLLSQPSPLRARAYFLWGQSLSRVQAYGSAQEKLLAALADAAQIDRGDINYVLGFVDIKLGKYPDAEKHLKAIPTDHERAAASVRLLATIALETRQADRAQFWIEKGRKDYPEAFLDSWGDYGLVQIALAKGDLPTARGLMSGAQKQYPPSDPWLILMQASLENAEWKREREAQKVP